MNAKKTKAFYCTNCGEIYLTESEAEACCKPNECEGCGAEIPHDEHKCEACKEVDRFNAATKYTYLEYEKQFPDMGLVYYNGEYYANAEHCVCSVYNCGGWTALNAMTHIWGVYQNSHNLNAEKLILDFIQSARFASSKVSPEGLRKLSAYLHDWNKRYGFYSFSVDYKTAILISSLHKKKLLVSGGAIKEAKRLVAWQLDTGFGESCMYKGSFEVDASATEEEIEELAKEEAFDKINWYWKFAGEVEEQ